MAHIQFTDEVVKEYLLYRGFSGTLKTFENDLKIDKEKGFRIDRMVEGLLQYVYSYDLAGLREAWSQLETRLFGKIDQHFVVAIKKLESAIFKFYLVHATDKNNSDKVNEFFMKMTQELSGQADWKEWFTLPFVKNPEEMPSFAVFFTRQWQESLFVSLHNFLAAVYQNLPLPTLAAFGEASNKVTALQKENEMLRRGIASFLPTNDSEREVADDMIDLKDDFYNICQDIKTTESQSKTMKSIMKLGASSSGCPFPASSRVPKRQFVKRLPTTKRSSSMDARAVVGRSRERDSSLDATAARVKVDKFCVRSEGSFLFLSQDEYNDHQTGIKQLKLNARGNLVASLDSEGTVRTWSTQPSCKTVAVFASWLEANILEWVLHHERYLLCADSSGKIRLLDVKERNLVWELVVTIEDDARLEDIVSSPVESSAILIFGDKLLLLDLKTKKEMKIETSESVTCCAFTSNGQLVICGCNDGTVIVLDIKRNEVVYTLPSLSSSILQVQLTFDNQYCFSLDSSSMMSWVSLESKEVVQTFKFPVEVLHDNLRKKTFSVDSSGAFLLTFGSNSGLIFGISELGISKCLELGGHKAPITCIDWCFANQCATCVTASSDGKIRISTLLIDTVTS